MTTEIHDSSEQAPDHGVETEGAYEALHDHGLDLETVGHWAFGTSFEDPLAGVDTSFPDDVDAEVLGRYALALGDDALVFSHRLSQWCSRAPDLEDDIALANISLDLLGQARLLLARAAQADPGLVPELPAGSPVPPEDALAFFRDAEQFRNVRLVEGTDRDFAEAVIRLLLFSTWRLALWQRLVPSRDHVLSAIAAKGVKELAYHRDYAARWCVTLALGTEESRRRTEAAVVALTPWWPELHVTHEVDAAAAASGVGVDPATVREEAQAAVEQVFAAADLVLPDSPGPSGRRGRDGTHTEALSLMLAEMQSVARAHPQGSW